MRPKKVLTLCIVHTNTHVLLGMKKRGFGEGKWNGFGGKVDVGESLEMAAVRELWEESGLLARTVEKQGILEFELAGDPDLHEVHVFSVGVFSGEPKESQEMRPQWFLFEEIPFNDMWADDRYWLPLLLEGKRFRGSFSFRPDYSLSRHALEEVEKNAFLGDIARRL